MSTLYVMCAWCGAEIERRPCDRSEDVVSHGICASCMEHEMHKLNSHLVVQLDCAKGYAEMRKFSELYNQAVTASSHKREWLRTWDCAVTAYREMGRAPWSSAVGEYVKLSKVLLSDESIVGPSVIGPAGVALGL